MILDNNNNWKNLILNNKFNNNSNNKMNNKIYNRVTCKMML